MANADLVSTLTSLASPFVAAFCESIVKPKIKALFNERRVDIRLSKNAAEGAFNEYLLAAYVQHASVTNVVFQNQQRPLVELYVPLTLTSTRDRQAIRVTGYPRALLSTDVIQSARLSQRERSDDTDFALPSTGARVLIVDTAGAGKTTLLRRIFLSAIEETAAIPVWIQLRRLAGYSSVIDYLENELTIIGSTVDAAFLEALIQRGDFVFMMDGYDEVASDDKPHVTRLMQDFVAKARKNDFIVSSRPEPISLPQFNEFRIRALTREEAYRLLERFDNSGELSTELIAKCDADALSELTLFLGNPLLLSLLFRAYEYKRTLPRSKHVFYRQVYDSLFESHDLSKGDAFVREKRSGLDADQCHRVLRAFAFITAKLNRIEYDRDQLMSLVEQAQTLCAGLVFKTTDLIRDLLVAVPLFEELGDRFVWCHRSFQDYFAAQFICVDSQGKQDEILAAIYDRNRCRKYGNVLDLCYDIDYKGFRRTILRRVANECIAHWENSFAWADGVTNGSALRARRALTFGRRYVLLPRSTVELREGHIQLHTVNSFLKMMNRPPVKEDVSLPSKPVTAGHMIAIETPAWAIMELLRSKQDPWFRSAADLSIEATRKGRLVLVLRNGSEYDDRQDSPVNQTDTFSAATAVLAEMVDGYLDPNVALELLAQVSDEIAREITGDAFVEGI